MPQIAEVTKAKVPAGYQPSNARKAPQVQEEYEDESAGQEVNALNEYYEEEEYEEDDEEQF